MFISLLIYYLYKNASQDIYHHVFMYDGWDKNTNPQTNSSTKYILNIYRGVMQIEIYYK